MKINPFGIPVVSSQSSRTESRRAAATDSGETGATIRISREARTLEVMQSRLSGLADIREDKVQEARLALMDGSLYSDEAINTALDRLLADL